MAVYFAKCGAAATGKEYQHCVPREWLSTALVCTECGVEYDEDLDECPDCGSPEADVVERGSAGRFWGYRKLHRVLAVRQVTPQVDIAAGRIARRWYRAMGLTKEVAVQRVEQATCRVTYRRSRGASACSPTAAASSASTTVPRSPPSSRATSPRSYSHGPSC